jgi:transketolase
MVMEKVKIIDALGPYFEQDKKLFLFICDYGFGAIDNIKSRYPDRVLNTGIMEQATVGIAAGMAMSGFKPVVFGIVNFLVMRAFEQIRNDIALQNLNVKLIGFGADDYFRFLGPSHTCGRKDVQLMHIAGVRVWDLNCFLSSNDKFNEIFDAFMKDGKTGYLRI